MKTTFTIDNKIVRETEKAILFAGAKFNKYTRAFSDAWVPKSLVTFSGEYAIVPIWFAKKESLAESVLLTTVKNAARRAKKAV